MRLLLPSCCAKPGTLTTSHSNEGNVMLTGLTTGAGPISRADTMKLEHYPAVQTGVAQSV